MSKRILRFSSVIIILTSLFYSCKKGGIPPNEKIEIRPVISAGDARKWYESLAESKTKQSDNGYIGSPDWNNSFSVPNTEIGGILKVPLGNINSTSYEYKDLVFHQQVDGVIRAKVLLVLVNPQYLKQKLAEKVASTTNIRSLVDNADFTGYLLQFDIKGNLIEGQTYEKGLLKAAIIIDSNKNRIPKPELDCDNPSNTNSPDCIIRMRYKLNTFTFVGRPSTPPATSTWLFPSAPGGMSNMSGSMPIGGGVGSGPTSVNFKVSDQLKKNNPRLVAMIKGLHEYVKNNKNVMDALVKFSGLSEKEILKYTSFGEGPEIKLSDNIEGFGMFSQDNPTELLINAAYARGLEVVTLPETQQATAFLLAVSVLHEFTHWGRFSEELPARGPGGIEMGWEFERAAYKTVISELNAGKYSIQFYKK